MKIKISNVAKVYDADISIEGISVIAGLNNTGKSTILKSIYSGLNIFRNVNEKVRIERKQSVELVIRRTEQYFDNNGYSQLPTSLLIDFAYLLNENIDKFVDNPDNFELFKVLFSECLYSYTDILNETDNKSIYTDEFLDPIYQKAKEVFSRTKEHYMAYIGEMYIKNVFYNQLNNDQNKMLANINVVSENGENYIEIINNKIEKMSNKSINAPDAIYLPSFSLLDRINGSRTIRSKYSPEEAVRRYLFEDTNSDQSYEEYQETEENINLIKEFLEEVVHGKLEKTPSGEFRYVDGETDSSISITNIASGLKPFLVIQSLVEHGRLKKNSVLLIDEPETNLHPEWHLIFAELLVLMYKYMGVMSVVNSHSPYFIRALEVKMQDYEIKDVTHFYFMEECEKNLFVAKDVSNETNKIYEKLYKPLEYL